MDLVSFSNPNEMYGNDCLLLRDSKSKFNQNGKKMKKLGKILMLAMAIVLR